MKLQELRTKVVFPKARWWLLGIAALTVAATIYGISMRRSFTNLTGGENWEASFQTAVMLEEKGIKACESMEESLPSAPYILRVQVLEKLDVRPDSCQQKVAVKEVYAGEGLGVGDEFYLSSVGWYVVVGDMRSIGRGYVNVLEIGQEYLVFLSGEAKTLDSPLPVYLTYTGEGVSENTIPIVPVFCYNDTENLPVSPADETFAAVPYDMVRDNEFFGATTEVIEAWEQLKAEMLQKYPR